MIYILSSISFNIKDLLFLNKRIKIKITYIILNIEFVLNYQNAIFSTLVK